jgi:16S rRNA (adenine1518-N6/adenine1519-N6)-dimethyltransferase
MRRLGQHFLKNNFVAKKIVAALQLVPDDTIIEIGPGHGELTEVVERETQSTKHGIKIIAIEKDRLLAEQLRKKFAANNNIEIVEGDALLVLPRLCSMLHVPCSKLCGNIPYYITGHLLRTIGEFTKKPSLSVLMVQKEVAERIVATPPRMNRLAASVQFWAIPKILAHVSKNEFTPPPEVDSIVLELTTKNQKQKIGSREYYEAVRALFQQPRKTILNNLVATEKAKREVFEEGLSKIGVPPESRPQNLSTEDIIRIALYFDPQKPPEPND